jgi:shikimate dehydrogenase
MHNAGFAALGLNAAYLPLQTADADDFVAFGKAMKLRGASVTAPHKVAMLDRVDEVDAMTRRVGALNTVVVRNGRWYGANTDVDGFLAPLVGRMTLKGTRATVLGAGGAARAVAIALAQQGASVTVSARKSADAAAVAQIAGGRVEPMPPRPGSWDVLVNATPCGSHASPASPMAGTRLDGEIVFDLIYSPSETELIRDARQSGCLTIGGIEMLVAQAERQFQMWTGQRPPAGLFRAAAETALNYDAGLAPGVVRSTREADNL